MKLNVNHLVELLEYLHKEDVLEVEVGERAVSTGLIFNFFDKENRECSITLYQAPLNMAPDLEKKMKLYTRVGKAAKKKDYIKEALEYKAKKDATKEK